MIKVAALWRHPIKSHGAERLERVTVKAEEALPFDRHWAVAHEATEVTGENWAPCQNFSRAAKAPELMAIGARLDEVRGMVTLTHPDRAPLTFDPDRDGAQLIDWAGDMIPEGRARSARVVRAKGQAWTDSPFPSVSLASLATLDAVSKRVGQPLDPRRFRANIWIEGAEPWAEFEWISRDIHIGSVTFRVEERITRCLATAANPETGSRDADTLGALEAGWGHRDFGVYLMALQDGKIAVGDRLAT